MPSAKTAARGGVKGFKLTPKKGVRPVLEALGITSARATKTELILTVKARPAKGATGVASRQISIPQGIKCGVPFSWSGCKGHKVFKKVNIGEKGNPGDPV